MVSVWLKVGICYSLSDPVTVFHITVISGEAAHNSDAVHWLYLVYSEYMIFSPTWKFILIYSSAYIHIMRFGNSTWITYEFRQLVCYTLNVLRFFVRWLQTVGKFMFKVYINPENMKIFMHCCLSSFFIWSFSSIEGSRNM